MLIKVFLAFTICIVVTSPSPAAEHTGATEGFDCAVGDQTAINQCEAEKFKKAEAVLNRTYQSLFRALDDEHQDFLKTAQSSWVAFRDANCALEASQALHGSMYNMLFEACRATATDARNKELNELKSTLGDFLR